MLIFIQTFCKTLHLFAHDSQLRRRKYSHWKIFVLPWERNQTLPSISALLRRLIIEYRINELLFFLYRKTLYRGTIRDSKPWPKLWKYKLCLAFACSLIYKIIVKQKKEKVKRSSASRSHYFLEAFMNQLTFFSIHIALACVLSVCFLFTIVFYDCLKFIIWTCSINKRLCHVDGFKYFKNAFILHLGL